MKCRYWVTGVQLGMLQACSYDTRLELAREILDKQWIENIEDLKGAKQ